VQRELKAGIQRSESLEPTLSRETTTVLDERTLEILEHKRRTMSNRRRGWLVRRMLLLADVIGLSLAFVSAELVFGPRGAVADRFSPSVEILVFLATLPAWIIAAKVYGLYDRDEERTDHTTVDDLVGVFHLLTIGAWFTFVSAHLTEVADPQLSKILFFWGLALVLVTVGRAFSRAFCRRQSSYQQNTVIVGAGDVGQTVAHKLLQHPEYGISVLGFIDSKPKERRSDVGDLTLLGSCDHLPGLVRDLNIERVIIAFSNDSHEHTLHLIRSLKDLDVQIDIVPRLFDVVGPGVSLHSVEGLTLIGLAPFRLSRSSRFLKRSTDVSLAALGLVLLLPLFLVVAVAIKLDSSGPVLFGQIRTGLSGNRFRMYKFRTMTVDADQHKESFAHLNKHARAGGDPRMFKIADDPRVTRVGRFLRRYSFDELPQLINVVQGTMSLVGPRPLIPEEDRHVHAWARQRLRLKPGMTGPWQVLGASGIAFHEMVRLDYLYVTSWSLGNDLKLLLRTLPAIFRNQNFV
jgi:exopolysaccharide biosynthesis polyprenyl glycosylphosphotransferase